MIRGKRKIELGVISIEMEGDPRSSKKVRNRGGVEVEQKRAKHRALRNASIEGRCGCEGGRSQWSGTDNKK